MQRNDEMRRPKGSEGNDGPFVYHGRGLPQEEEAAGKRRGGLFGGIFRGNPILLMVMADIVIIVLIGGFLYPFLRARQDAASIAGYSFTLHAYLEEGSIYANVVVERSDAPPAEGEGEEPLKSTESGGDSGKQAAEQSAELPEMVVIFRIPETGVRSRHGILPPRAGDPRIVRSRIEAGKAQEVRAEIRFAGETVELQKALEQ
jgi:hypothetical protein